MSPVARFDPVALLTLREIRTFIRRSSARGGVVFFALLYVLGSLFLGGMVVLGNIRGGYTISTVWGGAASGGSWNYPGLLIVAPWGVVSLPFFATVAMIVVGIGVGFGMTVAFLLGIGLLRSRATARRGTSTVGAVAGLTPAMLSLVTLGACCSTTAAATAGVGLVAQASGTSVTNLLLNNWYLGVFQIVMVWVALIAQEMLLVVYAGLFGGASELRAVTEAASGPSWGVRFLSAGLVRILLLGAGVVWLLAILADWTTINPAMAGPGYWYRWVVEHGLVGGVAVTAALFPASLYRIARWAQGGTGRWVGGLFVVGSLSLLVWVPPPLPGWGVDALINQMLGVLGAPAGWGAIAPGPVNGLALYLRWTFEYVLLGGFSLAAFVWPGRVFPWLTGRAETAAPAIPTALPGGGSLSSVGPRASEGLTSSGAASESP
jgi:hypothetical protein